MTQKILLAESLDLLRQCETKEYELDSIRTRTSNTKDMPKIVMGYYAVYHQYVRALEILNFVRHQVQKEHNAANPTYNRNLSEFCTNKMGAYMDRCENIIKKVDRIYVPAELAETITRDGYTPEATLFFVNGSEFPITSKARSTTQHADVSGGMYVLTIKNTDDYSVMSPDVNISVSITQAGLGAENVKAEKLPCKHAWRKFIGIVSSGAVDIIVAADGVRDSHVDILLEQWRALDGSDESGSNFASAHHQLDSTALFENVVKPSRQTTNASSSSPTSDGNEWLSGMPAIPDDELASLANYKVPQTNMPSMPPAQQSPPRVSPTADPWTQLEMMNVPHVGRRNTSTISVPDPVEVNPMGLTCDQRLAKVRAMLNAWPEGGVSAVNLPATEQRIVGSVYALPLPREFS